MNDSPQSSDPDQTLGNASGVSATTLSVATLREQLRPALLSVFLLTFLTGVIFPMALFVLARPLFPRQADGSLIRRPDAIIGSELIGQDFTGPGYFHPRPSAAGAGYDATSSGGTNLGPANPKLKEGASDDPKTADVDESFAGIRQLAEEYRKQNGVAADVAVPIDAVTASGSGLDPHISMQNALLQADRVAKARGMSRELLHKTIESQTEGRDLGIFGEPGVNVLKLNLDLDGRM